MQNHLYQIVKLKDTQFTNRDVLLNHTNFQTCFLLFFTGTSLIHLEGLRRLLDP